MLDKYKVDSLYCIYYFLLLFIAFGTALQVVPCSIKEKTS